MGNIKPEMSTLYVSISKVTKGEKSTRKDMHFCKFDTLIRSNMTHVYMWITMWKLGISFIKSQKIDIIAIFQTRNTLQVLLQKY